MLIFKILGSTTDTSEIPKILMEKFRNESQFHTVSSALNNVIEKPSLIEGDNVTITEFTEFVESHLNSWASQGVKEFQNRIDTVSENLIDETFFEMNSTTLLEFVSLWPQGSFEILLIVDTREVRSKEDRTFIQQKLIENGIHCLSRVMELGDFVWIARRKDNPQGTIIYLNVLGVLKFL